MQITPFLDFLKTAGALALNNQSGLVSSENQFKSDKVTDIVTQTDLRISAMFGEFCEQNFNDKDYLIIDEETVKDVSGNIFDRINSTEWTFVIDPVDGTLPYATNMPLWGISIGVLHYGKPFAGAIYMPALGELAYTVGEHVFWRKNAFAADETTTEIKPEGDTPSEKPIFFENPFKARLNDNQNTKKDIPMNLYSAVAHFMYMTTLRARGYFFGAKLWDLAGAWKALDILGLKIFSFESEEILNEVSPTFFKDTLSMQHIAIVCHPSDFAYLKNISRALY